MKTVGFIGAYDKSDLILYIARLLKLMGKKVLIVDATTLQKMKYLVPAIDPTKSYVTTFEEMDVAVGLYDYNSIKEYLGMPLHAVFTYDYILLDIDSPEGVKSFDIKAANQNYFVTNFSVYALKRGVEILSGLTEPIPLTKVLFSKGITKEEDDYLTFITLGVKAMWDEEKIYFPFEQGDQSIIMENQRVAKIKIKKLTQMYKESLLYLTEKIVDNEKETNDLKKAYRQLEKGV